MEKEEPDVSSIHPTRLHMEAGTTPSGIPVKSAIEITQAELYTLEYLAKFK